MAAPPAEAPGHPQGLTTYSNVPIPDPSLITTEQINNARAELRAEIKEAANAIREIIEIRLSGQNREHALVQEDIKRGVTDAASANERLGALFDEKLNGILTRFDGIAVQFRERDIRTDQDKIAASTAVNAALQAQKEAAGAQNESNAAAITKSENSFTKEIDGLKALIATTKDSINSQIGNLTGRLDRGEGGATGAKVTRDESRQGQIAWIALGGLIFSVIAGLVGFNLSHFVVATPAASYAPPPGFTLTPLAPTR
jgi:hypothetical protein